MQHGPDLLTAVNVYDYRNSLLLSKPPLNLLKPFSRFLCPMRSKNSINAGLPTSLLYISSSVDWPYLQYIIPTL